MPIPIQEDNFTVERPRLRDMVHERLRDAIMDGTFVPGEDLIDKELEEWLGTSRTPIRDAIHELARSGLVETEPYRHTRVVSPDAREALGSLHALGAIYSGSLRLAIASLNISTLRRATESLTQLADALASENIREGAAIMFDTFERIIAQTHDNQHLTAARIGSVYGLYFRVREGKFTDEQFRVMSRSCLEIREALIGLDPLAAQRATEQLFLFPPLGARGAMP